MDTAQKVAFASPVMACVRFPLMDHQVLAAVVTPSRLLANKDMVCVCVVWDLVIYDFRSILCVCVEYSAPRSICFDIAWSPTKRRERRMASLWRNGTPRGG
jgi:hypothetical protein